MKINYFSKALSLILSLSIIIASFTVLGGMAVNASDSVDAELENGDFENGKTGWAVTADSGDTFTVVSTSEAGSFNSAFKSGNVAKVTPGNSASWLYQALSLSKGTYVLKFSCYTDANNFFYGVYSSSEFSASTIIHPTKYSACRPDGTDATSGVVWNTSSVPAYGGPGNASRSNTYEFTLSEDTTVYFAIRCNTDSSKVLYVDNVSLTKEVELPTELQNGDFENGTTGWNVTKGATAGTFKIVNGIQETTHKNIKITKNAGYFVTGGTDTWLYQGVKLAAGEYTWKFHLDLYGKNNMVGAYTSKSGIGTGASLINAGTFKAVNDSNATSTSFKKDTNDYRIGFRTEGNYHYTVTYVFTLTEKTEVYFAIRGNGGACQYIDNMSLVKAPNTKLENGNFETGDLTGFENKTGSSIQIVDRPKVDGDATTFTGYAAYMPGGDADKANTLLQKVKLPAGEYVWKFDTDLIITDSGWSFLFGVYTGLTSQGVGYGSKSAIGTAYATNNTGAEVKLKPADNNNGYYIEVGNAQTIHATIELKFTITEETTLYFDIRTTANAHSYIDNMILATPTPGDANYDGEVDIRDLVKTKKLELGTGYSFAADFDDDGLVDSDDLTEIRRNILGIVVQQKNSVPIEG